MISPDRRDSLVGVDGDQKKRGGRRISTSLLGRSRFRARGRERGEGLPLRENERRRGTCSGRPDNQPLLI